MSFLTEATPTRKNNMSLTYKMPKPIRKPFVKGEVVQTCDRNLVPMGKVKVVYAGRKIVRTEDGRTWRATDGWYVGRQVWPFPSIRHKRGK